MDINHNNTTSRLNGLKKHAFFEILDLVDRVFVIAKYSENIIIGNRGFLPEEKEKGIILVFNKHMKFQWDDTGLKASLVFGSSIQKCFIPTIDIISVYSPELRVQLVIEPSLKADNQIYEEKKENKQEEENLDNIVKIDFTKKKK